MTRTPAVRVLHASADLNLALLEENKLRVNGISWICVGLVDLFVCAMIAARFELIFALAFPAHFFVGYQLLVNQRKYAAQVKRVDSLVQARDQIAKSAMADEALMLEEAASGHAT